MAGSVPLLLRRDILHLILTLAFFLIMEYEARFAPSDLTNRYAARVLGYFFETPIVVDYVNQTNGSLVGDPRCKPPTSCTEIDWWDDANRRNYIDILMKRHPQLDRKAIEADARVKDRVRWPDILTFDGFSGKPPHGRDGDDLWGRYEFYDVKPDSASGKKNAIEKLASLIPFYSNNRLPYLAGFTYPKPTNPRIVPTPLHRKAIHLINIYLRAHGYKSIKVELEVERRESGILYYRLLFRFSTDSRRSNQELFDDATAVMIAIAAAAAEAFELNLFLGSALASGAAAAATAAVSVASVIASISEEIKQAASSLLGGLASETSLPRIHATYPDLAEPLKPAQNALEDVLYSRGIALPSDEMAIFCEEAYFQNAILDRTIAERTIQSARVTPTPVIWELYASARPGWTVITSFASKAAQLAAMVSVWFPGLSALWDAILKASSNDDLTVVNTVLISTAAVAAYAKPSLIQESYEPAEGFAPDTIAMSSLLMAKGTKADAAVGAGVAGNQVTQSDLLKALVKPQTTPSDLFYLNNALSRADLLKKGIESPLGFTLATASHAVYASAGSSSRYGNLVGMDVSRLFVAPIQKGFKSPDIYRQIDMSQFGSTTSNPIKTARYCGRIFIS